jgi:hypothetical protein
MMRRKTAIAPDGRVAVPDGDRVKWLREREDAASAPTKQVIYRLHEIEPDSFVLPLFPDGFSCRLLDDGRVWVHIQ